MSLNKVFFNNTVLTNFCFIFKNSETKLRNETSAERSRKRVGWRLARVRKTRAELARR